MKVGVIIAAVAFGVGGIVGHSGHTSHKVDFVKVPQTKIVHETKTVTKTKPFSDTCAQALDAADRIYRAGSQLDAASTRQIDLLGEARTQMAENDMVGMGKVLEKQWTFDSNTATAAQNLTKAEDAYFNLRDKCK